MLYGKKWTIEEDEKLLNSIKNNKTFVEIANEHERTTRAIECRVCLHAVKYMEKENKNIQEATSEFKLGEKALEQYIDYKNNKDGKKNSKSSNSMNQEQFDTIVNLLTEIKDMLKEQQNQETVEAVEIETEEC